MKSRLGLSLHAVRQTSDFGVCACKPSSGPTIVTLSQFLVSFVTKSGVLPKRKGERMIRNIALWPKTRVVKFTYSVSQKQNGFNNKGHWYNISLTFTS